MHTNLQKAVDGNCADYMSYYVLGYTYLFQGKNKESIPYLLKSVKLNKDYATSQYNLAYAYLYSEDLQNALKYAKNSLGLYTDQVYKSDAAQMDGQIYTELKDDKKAIKYYALANKILPGNYYTLKALLYLYVKIDDKKAEKTTSTFFNLEPTNPTIYNDLANIYFSNDKVNALNDFYRTQFAVFKNDENVQGNLNFYLGQNFIESDKKVAKDYFLKAQEIFSKLFDKNHQVFEAIEDGLKECE
jgi:tetratricopeptide (TPR) repeat protein